MAAKHLLTGVQFSRIALVDKGASFDPKTGDGAHVLLFKRAKPAEETTVTETIETLNKKLADLTAENAELKKKAPGAAPAPEDILKGASPEVRALFEKQAAAVAKATEEAAANKAAIETITKAAKQAELRKRAEVYASLSGDKEVLAHIIGACESMETEEPGLAKKLEEMLKGWEAQVKKGGVLRPAFGSRGTTETPAGGGGSAFDEIEALAEAIVTKSEGKTTKADAIAKVLSDPAHVDLYERHRAESSTPGTKTSAA